MKAVLVAVVILGVGLASASKCTDARAAAEKQASLGILGAFAPKCESDGRFHHTQCVEAFCSCVNQDTGAFVPGSSGSVADMAQIEARCGSACEQERAKALTSGLMGDHAPQCDNGKYHHTQCHENFCACADVNTGKTVPDTAGPVSDLKEIEAKCASKCERQRASIVASGLIGAHAPQCDNGKFHPVQCKEAVCFCVDQETGETKGTGQPVSDLAEMEKTCTSATNNFMAFAAAPRGCEEERAAASGMLGAFKPKCESNGRYYPMQCQGSVCYCVERVTGSKIAGTEGHISKHDEIESMCQRSNSMISFAAAPKGCEAERASASGMMGAFKPKCEKNGMYYPMQCRESVCFCVERVTGSKIAGTEGHVSKHDEIEKKCQASNNMMSFAATTKGCKEELDAATSSGKMGVFKPKCEENGMYYPMQCHGSVCFCVERITGSKIAGTEGHISKYGEIEKKCQASNGFVQLSSAQPEGCEARREAATKGGLLGAFKPECSDNGHFQPGQCHEGSCFCVDVFTGEREQGSEKQGVSREAMNTRCIQRMSPCEKDRMSSGTGMGAFIPKCSSNGRYEKKQCHGSVCFCVDADEGNKIEGSEAHIASYMDCEKTECQRQLSSPAGLLGAFRPKCNSDNGNFEPIQCREAECFCVNRVTGKQEGKSVPVGQHAGLKDQCMTACEKTRDSLSTSANVFVGGLHAPKCAADGSYYKVQCQEAVCECVTSTGKSRPGTQKNIGQYRQLERQCPGTKQCSSVKSVPYGTDCPNECTQVVLYGRGSVYCCCA